MDWRVGYTVALDLQRDDSDRGAKSCRQSTFIHQRLEFRFAGGRGQHHVSAVTVLSRGRLTHGIDGGGSTCRYRRS